MTGPFTIRTSRLELIAGNHEMAEAEMTGIQRLSRLIDAEFAHGWPPPENDENTMEWFFTRIYDNPDARGWLMWYFILDANNKRTVIGNGGFMGIPDRNGVVKCGYSILEPVQNNGYATEALAGLIKWAFASGKVNTIIAHTLEGHQESINVLKKNQFNFVEMGRQKGTMKYELPGNRKNF